MQLSCCESLFLPHREGAELDTGPGSSHKKVNCGHELRRTVRNDTPIDSGIYMMTDRCYGAQSDQRKHNLKR